MSKNVYFIKKFLLVLEMAVLESFGENVVKTFRGYDTNLLSKIGLMHIQSINVSWEEVLVSLNIQTMSLHLRWS